MEDTSLDLGGRREDILGRENSSCKGVVWEWSLVGWFGGGVRQERCTLDFGFQVVYFFCLFRVQKFMRGRGVFKVICFFQVIVLGLRGDVEVIILVFVIREVWLGQFEFRIICF